MHKFKVGDKVTTLENYGNMIPVGTVGEVFSLHPAIKCVRVLYPQWPNFPRTMYTSELAKFESEFSRFVRETLGRKESNDQV